MHSAHDTAGRRLARGGQEYENRGIDVLRNRVRRVLKARGSP